MLLSLSACDPPPFPSRNTNREVQSQEAQRVADSIQFAGNAEIDNIRRKLELTSSPNLLGFIVLLNEAGQPIAYHAVRGKVTSSGKRLRPSVRVLQVPNHGNNGGQHSVVIPTPSDEGTYGSSDSYVYFWNTSGAYVQWSGHYLYSDRPIRLNVQPLVVNMVTEEDEREAEAQRFQRLRTTRPPQGQNN